MKTMYYTIYISGAIPYIASAKRTPFINGDPVHKPGKIQLEFGGTREEALDKLKKRLLGYDWVEWTKDMIA